LHLLREDHLSRLVPAHIEFALIHVDVLLLHLMWGMLIVLTIHPGLRRVVIVEEQCAEIVRIGCHEAIVVIESLTAGPMLKGAALRSFRQRRVIAFAAREGFKARVLKMFGAGFHAPGWHAVVARNPHR